jgi:hypothetical protein
MAAKTGMSAQAVLPVCIKRIQTDLKIIDIVQHVFVIGKEE